LTGWQRWIPLTGILFVILFVGAIFLASLPGGDDSDQEVLDWYTDSGNRTSAVISAYLWVIASLLLVIFVNRLRYVIQDAEGGTPLFATGAFAGGIGAAFCLIVAAMAFAAIPAGIEFGDDPPPTSVDVPRAFNSLGFGLQLVGMMFMAIVTILSTAAASFRYRLFPTWFNWLSIICAIALLFAVIFLPGIALLIWLVVASILLFQRQPATARQNLPGGSASGAA
jgi:hypothetical protein